MKIFRRWVLALVLCAAPLPLYAQVHAAVLSDAQQRLLEHASAYLDDLHRLQARFSQTGPDGATITGTVWLERPGRMRFQYDPPSPLLLVASGGKVIFHDSQLDQTTTIPATQTPLGLLLGDKIALQGDVTVTDLEAPPGRLEITLVRTKLPGEGSLTLFFSEQNFALTGWSVIDAQGKETQVHLNNLQSDGRFDPGLFTFTDSDTDK